MDHLIAQVMEMGFEPEQARSALEFANNDVQAAIDILVENRNAEAEISHHKFKNIPSLPRRPEASRSSFDEDDYQHPLPAWRSGKKSPSGSQNRTRQDGEGAGFDMASFQMHKEKFMSNASTIGASVLSKANLFMKQASEKIRESIDDIQQRAENFQNEDDRFKRTGRPRWMQDYAEEDSSDDEVQNGYTRQKSRFADDRNPDLFSSPKSEKVDNESWNQRSQPHSANATRTSRAPKPPVSPGYQRTQKPAASPPPVAPKPQRPPRTVVAASPEQIQLSDKHKTAGNEKFKLGQFGGAEEMFSQAISALPAKHDNLILLHNNRAAARIKVGDYHGAVADCNLVVELVSDNYLYPSPNDPFNFKDQLVKALTRRGSANESKEKYEEAEKDFNKLLSIDPSNRSGLEGVRRCRKAIKMINGETEVKISNVSKSPQSSVSTDLFSLGQPSSSTGQAFQSSFGAQLDEFGFATIPASSTSNSRVSKEDLDKSEAVARLRAQDKFAEQEEEEKLRINDMVEDRLNQWRSNKIGNLRAMIASLDSILWPELNWKPCGLQDLIQPNQVKSKYMRAIAKLHPDKLATTETVEHKLLASGIFSTLNEAWDQFKAQNRL
ncbi:hypothetical protein K493DRAFT_52295 [Basidiobolus meristosporus CBS 931.73]|uniref:UBA domain-containing protein n=1 Tax=Basidiobolus meristosporus CBS 931.73 TaxID=1314790 RepID=A0A1Y1XZT6_9FUNG|nr:hypothetical protein K493DRAFT_52295 [Basidiobolus meristosporus CBS 931.73]|eukprot:ORX91280.1 hypothetical protein K493DRAFT_52295 [Basidiobolus meristosporus CBS 931.73]